MGRFGANQVSAIHRMLDVGHAGADLFHHTGKLMAEGLPVLGGVGSQDLVMAAEAAGPDRDHHFALAGGAEFHVPQFELVGCYLVMTCLGGNTQFVAFDFEFFHKCRDAWRDRAEIVVFQLLIFSGRMSHKCPSCQAEVGTAAAMAASALTELFGGSPSMCLDAASYTIANLLGLVCDPIAGLVEAPCQKRNAIGASAALTSAEMALAGIKGIIPFDETVKAMYTVGRKLPLELRETALGGMAATPTGCGLCKEIYTEV